MTCKDCIHYFACSAGGGLFNEKDESKEMLCKRFASKSRYVELPCEVGDTVYVDSDTWGFTFRYFDSIFIYSKHFLVGEVVSIIKTKKQLLMKIRVPNLIHTRYEHRRYTVNAIGQTVFLTKKEAEKALAERVKK